MKQYTGAKTREYFWQRVNCYTLLYAVTNLTGWIRDKSQWKTHTHIHTHEHA